MPGWDTFRQQVKTIMELLPADSDDLAKVMANAYDMAVKTPPAGDLLIGNPVMTGNVAALENVIKSVFDLQLRSAEQLPLFELFTSGFQTYWAGTTLQIIRQCITPPAPTATINQSTVSVVCLNPGQKIPIPAELLRPESTVTPFIENFINAAEAHFKTLSGAYNVMAIYGIAPAATTGPGIVPWVGYTVDATKIIENNEIEQKNLLQALGGFETIEDLVFAWENGASDSGSLENLLNGASGSYNATSGSITKEQNDFNTVCSRVIKELEGGYYHPDMLADGRIKDGRYSASGETMYGIDRKTGGTINETSEGRKFWALIDAKNARKAWSYNYLPSGQLRDQLYRLCCAMIKRNYDKFLERYIGDKEIIDVINSDGRLMFNFVYATWNGPGWFQGWAGEIKSKYLGGMKDSGELASYFVRRRISNKGVLSGGNKQNSLIAQGGQKISKLLGISFGAPGISNSTLTAATTPTTKKVTTG
jgi:hypothetical protein